MGPRRVRMQAGRSPGPPVRLKTTGSLAPERAAADLPRSPDAAGGRCGGVVSDRDQRPPELSGELPLSTIHPCHWATPSASGDHPSSFAPCGSWFGHRAAADVVELPGSPNAASKTIRCGSDSPLRPSTYSPFAERSTRTASHSGHCGSAFLRRAEPNRPRADHS